MDILDAGNEVGEPEAQRLRPRTGFLIVHLENTVFGYGLQAFGWHGWGNWGMVILHRDGEAGGHTLELQTAGLENSGAGGAAYSAGLWFRRAHPTAGCCRRDSETAIF